MSISARKAFTVTGGKASHHGATQDLFSSPRLRGQLLALKDGDGRDTEDREPNRSSFFMSHSKNHHFRGLDEGSGRLPRLEIHLAGRAGRDDRGDLLFTDRNNYLCHQATDSHALNSSD